MIEMKHSVKPLYVDRAAAAAMFAISETSLERQVREKEFPAPRQITPRRVGWLLRELEEHAEQLPVSGLPPPPNTGAKKPKTKPE
jgi:prophage regulatory protein